jgi:NadR type nicotinamide-nucleotide adenylyltransferase
MNRQAGSDPYADWDRLDAAQRGRHARRVVVVGAESTGKTTLSRALAAALNTVWVGEYGREYTLDRDPVQPWTADEFVAIAIEQNRREDAAACGANRILICDTDAFATRLWNRRYLGVGNAEVERIAALRRADLYLLSGDEIPFVPDRIRDGEHIRHQMQQWFEQALRAQTVPWRGLTGSPQARVTAALAEIGRLFEGSRWRPAAR